MRRILIAFALVAGFALYAGPAVAQEASDGPTPSQTTEPPPEQTPPPPEETTAPPAETPTPPTETPGPDKTTPGPGQNPGSGPSGGPGGSPSTKLLTTDTPVDDLGPTIDGKTVKVCQPSGPGTYSSGQVSAASVLDGSGVGAGDIVKPFTYSGGSFAGQNWDIGKSIYNNDCTAPTDVPSPGGGTTAKACETAAETDSTTVALTEGEEPAEAANPECDSAVQLLAVVERVTICHSRSAQTNPYGPQAQTVSVDSIFRPNGHATHTGGVFPEPGWGDIIPPFEHADGSFPGLNWSPEGQAIYFNDCQISDEEPPPPGEEKVTICHADSNPNQPYGPGPISPSVNGVLNGHAGHDAPVFFPGASDWGDIIPPFDHENGSFPGLNWDADGQAIFFNDCQVPGDEEPCPEDSEDEECEPEEECPDEESDEDESDEDESENVRALDDDEESDDDEECDEDDDDDDDDKGALLPDTGGTSLWTLLMGGLLTVLGVSILTNRESMGRIGLFGPVPSAAPAAAWAYTIGRRADLPRPVVRPEPHRGRWTALGAALLRRRKS